MNVILVTGGAGFIGSNFIRYFLGQNNDFSLVNIDKLTYAGNLNNLRDVENSPRYHFIKGDICNQELINHVYKKYRPDFVVNFAAESHVDRSIHNPCLFAETNLMGALVLLNGIRKFWNVNSMGQNRFVQISTDEVYGSIENDTDYFTEETGLAPNSPYSASKASADMMARAYWKTYGVPVIITRCCNNYGPCQNIEKFIPTCITQSLQDKPIPVYGRGTNIREWIHVSDHCTAISQVLFRGMPGEVYNIGSGEEISNMELAERILNILDKPADLIQMVEDRPGHDRRYALNSDKAANLTGWVKKYKLAEGLKEIILWYKDNKSWWEDG